ncbi:MAG: bifunctional folylpolyglutamate synthase/dihydrofolate synthase [Candidatus Cryptobacteroides sp.]
MEYDKLIEDIYSRHPSVQVSGFGPKSYKAGLEAMRGFDAQLGSPWRKYRIIHVAGTNGKGSVSSMLASCLAASGLSVGLYTSPHLLDFRERIKIVSPEGWEMVSKDYVQNFLEERPDEIEHLSFFEITTGLAFKWFADRRVDIAVIEVGLGGRLDSTNIIDSELAVVTSIGLDHCALLGSTREQIASEKGGIFKSGSKALVWGHDAQTDPVFEECARNSGARLHYADEVISEPSLNSIDFGAMDLRGEYQRDNVRTALSALSLLGIAAEPGAIEHTSRRTGLRGRWETLCEQPKIICDIGHNPAALEMNFAQLHSSGRPLTIVYGIMADKALDDIAPLMPADADYILCAPKGSRALPVRDLHTRLSTLRPELRLQEAPSVADAVKMAISKSQIESIIYIGGSTFVVAEALLVSNCK